MNLHTWKYFRSFSHLMNEWFQYSKMRWGKRWRWRLWPILNPFETWHREIVGLWANAWTQPFLIFCKMCCGFILMHRKKGNKSIKTTGQYWSPCRWSYVSLNNQLGKIQFFAKKIRLISFLQLSIQNVNNEIIEVDFTKRINTFLSVQKIFFFLPGKVQRR